MTDAHRQPELPKTKRRRRSPPPPVQGTVYFVWFWGNEIKIGFTTNLDRRLYELPKERGVGGRLLYAMPGTVGTETALHDQFQHLRMSEAGDYFHECQELHVYIDKLRGLH